MADIDQNETPNDVIFSALNIAAQSWMREHYENENVKYSLPDEQLRALEFRRAAEAHGFKIDVWGAPGLR